MCFLTGVGYAMRLPVPLPVWLAGVILVASWGLVLGPMMWRASSRDS